MANAYARIKPQTPELNRAVELCLTISRKLGNP